MIYLKCTLAGVLAVVVAAVAIVGLFALAVGMLGGDWRSGFTFSWKMAVTAALVFALGFTWQFRRTPKRQATTGKTTRSVTRG